MPTRTHINLRTGEIIGAAIEVHRYLGSGLLESVYHQCLARELQLRGIQFKYDWPLPLEYKGLRIEKGYRMDLMIEDRVIVEVKALTTLTPVHEAQLLTYMRLARISTGLLLNFHELVLKDGIRRKVLDFN